MLKEHQTQRQSTVRPIKIDVYADPSSTEDSGVAFRQEWKFDDVAGDPAKHGRIDLPPKVGFKLHFHFHDNTDRNLEFLSPGDSAMWADSAPVGDPPAPCPTSKGNGGQIGYNGPCTKYLLIVEDDNSGDPCVLTYALRFDGDAFKGPSGKAYPPYEYDPEIKNGGGNIPFINR